MAGSKPVTLQNALRRAKRSLAKIDHLKDTIEIKVYDDQNSIFLLNPWGDRSIAFIAYREGVFNKKLFDTLRIVTLPPELSAIYHTEKRLLEVIWTAYQLPSAVEEIRGRKFDFLFDGKTYHCEFGDSSDELVTLSSFAAYLQVSESSFRNLQSFSKFSKQSDLPSRKGPLKLGKPISFFIKNLDPSADDWQDTVKHINFYLKYYDKNCPHIVLHEDRTPINVDKIRYIEGSFPKKIVSRNLNQNLLSLWLSAYDHDKTTKFLLYYRILEYVSGLYLQAKQRQALFKVLNSPSALSSLDGTLDEVAAIVREDKASEIDRYLHMFEELVDKNKIWNEICCNESAFVNDVQFDGGLEIKALVSNTKSMDAFDPKGMQSVARSLRQIRHGLAHGGEAQAGRLILPTSDNFDRLTPWVQIAMVAAGEVVVYEHLT